MLNAAGMVLSLHGHALTLHAPAQMHVEVETNCWAEPSPWASNDTAYQALGLPPPTEVWLGVICLSVRELQTPF